MKKFFLFLIALLAFGFNMKAQQYVSTEPANRNAIIEEFTGRGCGYCTDGHRIANQIMANNPGRVWAINIHAGGYAYTSYPNMITADGNTIHGGFSIQGYPSGVVNRSTASAIDRGQWNGQCNTQLNQASECNVAGIARINPDTRVATITVEVYYTGNSGYTENFLTVAMLQDSILGTQADYGNYNPTQWLNGQYVHMHILRDVITPSAWGESISPTTAGTLITKTYEYQIPQNIGSPNGVDVNLDHIFFLAWVAERQQGNAYRPILTACELEKTTLTDEPIYPSFSPVTQNVAARCSQEKDFDFTMSNIGTETLTSIKFAAQVGEATHEFEWTGELASGDNTKVNFSMEIPFGTHTGSLNVTEANGVAYEASTVFEAVSDEWAVLEEEGNTTNITVYIIQDQFGEQITWDIINSDGETIASGGPYQHIIGTGTQPNVATVNGIAVNDCYLFRIYDSNGNGICCNYGQGYYYLKDAHGNRFIEGAGDFGSEASHLFSIQNPVTAVGVHTENPQVTGCYSAVFNGTLDDEADEVGFIYGKTNEQTWNTVIGELDGMTFTAYVEDLEEGTEYSVTAFAVSGGQTFYADEVLFTTWFMGVNELEQSLKVYPNPASNYLMVEGVMTSVEVYNAVGQCLLSKEVSNGTRIDLSAFNNGIYFLRVNNNGETAVRKFSVNR